MMYFLLYIYSHPRYRAALFQKFPSLACNNTDVRGIDNQSTDTGITAGSIEKSTV